VRKYPKPEGTLGDDAKLLLALMRRHAVRCGLMRGCEWYEFDFAQVVKLYGAAKFKAASEELTKAGYFIGNIVRMHDDSVRKTQKAQRREAKRAAARQMMEQRYGKEKVAAMVEKWRNEEQKNHFGGR